MIDRGKLVTYLEQEIETYEKMEEEFKIHGRQRLASTCFDRQWQAKRVLEMVRMGAFDKGETS